MPPSTSTLSDEELDIFAQSIESNLENNLTHAVQDTYQDQEKDETLNELAETITLKNHSVTYNGKKDVLISQLQQKTLLPILGSLITLMLTHCHRHAVYSQKQPKIETYSMTRQHQLPHIPLRSTNGLLLQIEIGLSSCLLSLHMWYLLFSYKMC